MVSLVGQKMYFKQKLFYNFVNSQTPNLRPRKNHSNYQSNLLIVTWLIYT